MNAQGEVALVLRGARLQLRVIGALVIREMHTRFGRHYMGYIWLYFEPLLLGVCIGLIHAWRDRPTSFGPFEFHAVGYILFFVFRGILNRATTVINMTRPLLYHRSVTLPDMFFARHIIEFLSCTGVMLAMLFGLFVMDGSSPESPLKMALAMIMMALFSQGLAFLAAALAAAVEGSERLVHAMTYLLLPASGLFFLVEWLPQWLAEMALWIPTVHLFELLRDGQFGSRFHAEYDLAYVWGWIMITHLLGLAALRVTRARVGLE
jgi:capsular polysaccharide transport system permease protein